MVALKVLFDEAMKKQRKGRRVNKGKGNRSNKTGFRWLTKTINEKYKKGYRWNYQRRINGHRVNIQATDLYLLFNKVRCKGLDWIMIDEKRARKTVENEGIEWDAFVMYMFSNGGDVDGNQCLHLKLKLEGDC